MMFKVTDDNKIHIKDYDFFNSDEVRLINEFNSLHTFDRSINLYELTCILNRKEQKAQ